MASGIITGSVAIQIRRRIFRSYQSVEERNRIINIFGQHVSPSVVNKLINQKTEILSEIRYVCVMFLDIRNFSSFAEGKNPAIVVDYLNNLFNFMIDIINIHNGIINKFLGDGFMAVFGVPFSDGRDCQNAVRASLQILSRIKLEEEMNAIPLTRVGIGLHAGQAVTGNVGSSVRKEYTIIGDVVNIAARIESLNKEYGSQLLISKAVWQAIPDMNNLVIKEIGDVHVKGRHDAVHIYQLA